MELPLPSSAERTHSDLLVASLRSEIAVQGSIPFSRFMERCLYAPGLGYYSAGSTKFGAAGDFVTAPELGTLFAESVVNAMAPVLRELGTSAVFFEVGGGSGAFAESALKAFAKYGVVPNQYWILEPSIDLRERQRDRLFATLPKDLAQRVVWLEQPPEQAWCGILFANEVIDALPVSRFLVRERELYEEHVTCDDNGNFIQTERPADMLLTAAVAQVERDLGNPFDEGYQSEILPQLPYWIQAIAGSLKAGLALFIDYGYPRREYYLAERHNGTLVCHYRHRAHNDPLIFPGLQDITAFVDFTALAQAGVAAGFDFAGYTSQAQFLLASGLLELLESHQSVVSEVERMRLVSEVKRLTLPGEMGERFQVMGFARNLDVLPAALTACDLSHRL